MDLGRVENLSMRLSYWNMDLGMAEVCDTWSEYLIFYLCWSISLLDGTGVGNLHEFLDL